MSTELKYVKVGELVVTDREGDKMTFQEADDELLVSSAQRGIGSVSIAIHPSDIDTIIAWLKAAKAQLEGES